MNIKHEQEHEQDQGQGQGQTPTHQHRLRRRCGLRRGKERAVIARGVECAVRPLLQSGLFRRILCAQFMEKKRVPHDANIRPHSIMHISRPGPRHVTALPLSCHCLVTALPLPCYCLATALPMPCAISTITRQRNFSASAFSARV